jgi:tetratricopeptide (TPR) repeat protein
MLPRGLPPFALVLTVAWLAAGTISVALASPTGDARKGVRLLSQDEYGPLRAAWGEVQSDLERKAWAEAAGRVGHLVAIRTDLGLANAFELSGALLHAAGRAREEAEVDAAGDLVAAAKALSPDLAAARFEAARQAFDQTAFSVGTQLRELRGAFEMLGRDVPATLGFGANLASLIGWVSAFLLGLFGVAMLLRYYGLLVSDLLRLLPTGVNRVQGGLLLLVLLVAPLVAGLGLLAAAACWIAATLFYQRLSERIASLLLFALLAGIPSMNDAMVRGLTAHRTPEAVIHRCLGGLCSDADRRELAALAEVEETAYDARFTLASMRLREAGSSRGKLDRAHKEFEQAMGLRETPEVLLELGRVEYFRALEECDPAEHTRVGPSARFVRQLSDARGYFQRVLALDKDQVAATYNASVVAQQLGDTGLSAELLASALELDSEGVQGFHRDIAKEQNQQTCQQGLPPNRHLMSASLQAGDLVARALRREVARPGLLAPLVGLFGGRVEVGWFGWLGLGGMGLVVLAWLLGPWLALSCQCRTCSDVALPRTRLKVDGGALCEGCILADIRRGLVDAKELWFREQRLTQEARRRARWQQTVSWVLPGFGHLLRGAPLRGLFLLGTIAWSLGYAWAVASVVQEPWAPSEPGQGRLVIPVGLAGLLWLGAVIGIHTARGKR